MHLEFVPDKLWKTGHYLLRVNARLEDLAGNNLNKVLDRDVPKETKQDGLFVQRNFEIKH